MSIARLYAFVAIVVMQKEACREHRQKEYLENYERTV